VLIGVLALQGDFAAHGRALTELGVPWRPVKTPADLEQVDALILPGGESTTLLKLLRSSGLWDALPAWHASGKPLMGTCAGVILLAREARQPTQPSYGLLDAVAIRNAYGRQVDSFIAPGEVVDLEALGESPLEMVFIRAPRLTELGPAVQVLATCRDDVVLVRQGTVLGVTFHPELTRDRRVHEYFLRLVAEAQKQSTDVG
jgi:5'-phosphate synthase pdxT subunit